MIIDNKLSFKEHVDALSRRAFAKIHALKRIAPFMSEEKRLHASNAFVMCETSYCPLIWSFSNKRNLGIVERIHRGVNRAIRGNGHPTLNLPVHRRHCELLLREVFKVQHDIGPSYMGDVFQLKDHLRYALRNGNTLLRHGIRTSRHGLLSLSHVAAQLWDTVPASVKNASSVGDFRQKLQSLEHLRCTCHLCNS